MSKRALLLWSIVWIVLGILVVLSTAKEIMVNPKANYIFAAGLTLYCFYNGVRGMRRFMNKDDEEENGENEENEEASCSGG